MICQHFQRCRLYQEEDVICHEPDRYNGLGEDCPLYFVHTLERIHIDKKAIREYTMNVRRNLCMNTKTVNKYK